MNESLWKAYETKLMNEIKLMNENKPPKMTNSPSTDVTFEGAWWNWVVAKQEDSHSTAPADKQIIE